jgi:hypothetical protein
VRRLLVTASVVPSSPSLVTLMKALSSTETSVITRGTRRNIPEDTILHSRLQVLAAFRQTDINTRRLIEPMNLVRKISLSMLPTDWKYRAPSSDESLRYHPRNDSGEHPTRTMCRKSSIKIWQRAAHNNTEVKNKCSLSSILLRHFETRSTD